MTKRERELVAEALRLAQAGVCVGQGKASLNGVSVPGMDVVIFFHDEPRELCQVLKKLLLQRSVRAEVPACLN